MLSKYDLRISDESAEAMFSDRAYEMAYNGEPLYYDEGKIYMYKNKYFDPEDAYGFVREELEAENFPRRYYGKNITDYNGNSLMVTEDTYDCEGYAFYSDESLEFLCFLGAKETAA